tara:strand:+ start:1182 stop:2009 length:828 start_codon:yes stop_codon:yes gene_type:complete
MRRLIDEAHARLDPDRALRIYPLQLSPDVSKRPLEKLELESQTFLAELKCRKPEQADIERIAIGQMRRNILKNHEHVSELIAQAKKSDAAKMVGVVRLFWFSFFLAVFYSITSMGFNIAHTGFPLQVVQSGIGISILMLMGSALVLIYMILCWDLPKVKLLRATSGFISASEPLSGIVMQIINDPKSETTRMQTSPTFNHVVRTINTQLDAEAQSLQIKQFWLAAVGTALGALVAAMAITFTGSNEGLEKLRCEVSAPDSSGQIIQTCTTESANP